MDFDGLDQTQAIALDDFSDDTDDLGDLDDKQPAGYLKVFNQKSFNETSFPVYEGDNFIGRHESNQICIPLKALSKKHACIEIQGDSHLIYDLESRNKTRRGKLFLKPSVRYELQDPDSLIFGDIRCQYTRAEIQKKPTEQVADSDDDGSDTGSESMLLDTQTTGEKAAGANEPEFGSSSSYDIIQPTQACKDREVKKTIVLETPQREGATLIFVESSDENTPAESVKAMADSSISPGSVAETPGSKPLAESTIDESVSEADIEEFGRTRYSDLDGTALAMAPTQAYGVLAELETQAYPVNTDSDQDNEDEEGDVRRDLFDAPTQAFGVPDSEDDMEQVTAPKGNKRISLEPTLMLNISTDDEKSPVKRPGRPKPFPENIAEETTLAYSDNDGSDTEEHADRNSNDDEGPTLGYPDLATQAYCADTDNQSDDEEEVSEPRRKAAAACDPTLKYDMQPGSPCAAPNQAEAETQAYCPETESDEDDAKGQGVEPTLKYNMDLEGAEKGAKEETRGVGVEQGGRGHGVEPTLKYDMGIEGNEEVPEGDERRDIALEPTLAYTTEEDDEEEMDISDIAGAATQAYTTTDSDSDDGQVRPRTHRPVQPTAKRQPIKSVDSEAPTLAYEDIRDDGAHEPAKARSDDEPSSEIGGAHHDEATLAYKDDNDEDEAMDTEMSIDEGEERMLGYAEMATQPAGGMEEPDANVPTLQYDTTEDEDDTTAATQAYGMDDGDEETPDSKSSSSLLDQPAQDGTDQSTEMGTSDADINRGGNKEHRQEDLDDVTIATQVYGADGDSETQVPDSLSQEGAEQDQPLVGISRISSMLRKVPARSAMSSPEKKQQPHRTRRVAFKEQTPPDEASPEEINPPARKSARSRKVPARFQETPATTAVTETDAKPTRRRSKDFRMSQEDEETVDASEMRKAPKGKRKGSQDVVEGQVQAETGDSEEDTLELKEGDDMVWKSTGGGSLPEVNNNEVEMKDKPPARRTSRRQASYKKAVEGHDSDDTESLSSTSSLQVEVGELAGSSVKVQVTVCDGKESNGAAKPRRGRRSNAAKEDIAKVSGTPSSETGEGEEPAPKRGRPTAASSAKRQSRRSAVSKDVAGSGGGTKPKSAPGVAACKSDDAPEKEQESKESLSSGGKVTRQSRGKTSAPETEVPCRATGAPASARKGRKPRSVAAPETKGPKQSSMTDFAVVVVKDMGRQKGELEKGSSKSEDKHSQQTGSMESTDSPSLLSPEGVPPRASSRSKRAKSSSSETQAKQPTKAMAKQDAFLAPEPLKRGVRSRQEVKEDKEASRSTTAPSETTEPDAESLQKEGSGFQAKGRKKGRISTVLETPPKDAQQPVDTPASSRRGKRPVPPQTTPTQSPAKKLKEPETPESEVASPSLRKRPNENKPKVMFTGVVNKAWEKIVTSLGGELVESVFDCTHLVTDKVRRTVKFLCCLSRGALIITPKWLDQCQLNKAFVDPSPYLLQDKAAEKQYGFQHATSHQRALQGGVLTELSIFVTASVKPEPAQMKEIIQCAGGKHLSGMPKKPDSSTVVISCEADEAKCQAAIKAGLPVVSAEFILTGMLRQQAQPELYQLFTSTSTPSNQGNKRKGSDNPSSSKRRR